MLPWEMLLINAQNPSQVLRQSLFTCLGPVDIAAGSANGTYLGANSRMATSDFINMQANNVNKFKVDGAGNVTAVGTVTATSFSGSGAGLTGITPTFAGLTPGGISYATSTTSMATTASVGLTGQALLSTGGGAPTWSSTTMTGANITYVSGGNLSTTGLMTIKSLGTNTTATSIDLAATGLNGGITLAPNGTGAVTVNGTNPTINPQAGKTLTLSSSGSNVGINTTGPNAQFEVDSSANTSITEIVRSFAAPTVDIWEVQNGVGVKQVYIDQNFLLNLANPPTATTGAATKAYVDAVAVGGAALAVRRDGTLGLTAAWNVGNQAVGNISTLSIGTPTAPTGGVATFNGNVGIKERPLPQGTLDVEGGTAAAGNGSQVRLVAQSGFTTGNTAGGNIVLQPGAGNGTGTGGSVGVWQGVTQNSMATYLNTNEFPLAPVAGGNFAPGLLVYGPGGYSYGIDIGSSGGRNRTRIFAPGQGGAGNADIAFSFHVAGTAPTSQNSLSDAMVVRGDTGNVGIGTTAPTATLDVHGHIGASQAGAPTVSVCDAGTTIVGNDSRGTITIGSTGNDGTCTFTFITPYANAPACIIVGTNQASIAYAIPAVSTTTTTLSVFAPTGFIVPNSASYFLHLYAVS